MAIWAISDFHLSFGVKDKFIEHDTVSNQMTLNEITPQNVIEVLKIF